MTKIARLFNIIFILVANSCERDLTFYKKNEVEILYSNINSDSVTIIYSTPLETMYYSPGVVYEYDREKLVIKFLRYGISEKAQPQVTESFLIKNVSDSLAKIYPPLSHLVSLPNKLPESCTVQSCLFVSD